MLLVIIATIPLAQAECYGQRVHAQARAAYILTPPPYPFIGFEVGTCASTPYTGQVDDHVFLPNMTEVLVHFHRDYGAGVPTLQVKLDGLGFTNQSFTLYRQAEELEPGFDYEMPAFVAFPGGPAASGKLFATVYYPGGDQTGVFRVLTVP